MPLPDLIPRSVLFGNPDHTSPSVSPDGSRLGWVAPEDGVLNVWVAPRDGSAPARAVTHDRDRGVRTYAFCQDDRHLLYLQDTAGDENWRLYLRDTARRRPDEVCAWLLPRAARASGVTLREAVKHLPDAHRSAVLAAR